MRHLLRLESIDDDPLEREFESAEDAIKFAVEWFVDGYNNDTIDRQTRIAVAEDAVELARALREGKEFHCSRFHESVSLCVL